MQNQTLNIVLNREPNNSLIDAVFRVLSHYTAMQSELWPTWCAMSGQCVPTANTLVSDWQLATTSSNEYITEFSEYWLACLLPSAS